MNHEVTDAVWELLHSGSRLLGEPMIMGITAENLAAKYGISRESQDQVALESHHKAEAAIKAGRFKDEIVPFPTPGKKGQAGNIRPGRASPLWPDHGRPGRLKPTFKNDGTVTAGNSSGLNDGAAAAILMTRGSAQELGLDADGEDCRACRCRR